MLSLIMSPFFKGRSGEIINNPLIIPLNPPLEQGDGGPPTTPGTVISRSVSFLKFGLGSDMKILEDQGKGRIRHDNQKNRRHHRGGGGGAHRLRPAPDLKAPLAADPGDEHGKDAGLDQTGDDIQQGQAVLGFLQVGVDRQV
jgi:hypothetical protein